MNEFEARERALAAALTIAGPDGSNLYTVLNDARAIERYLSGDERPEPQQLSLSDVEDIQRCIDDPLYFMEKHGRLSHPTKGAVPFEPYDFQKMVVRALERSPRLLINTGRQMGMLVTVAHWVLHVALSKSDVTVMINDRSYGNALETMQRVRYIVEGLPNHIRPELVEYNKGTVVFGNGSRIIARAATETAGRGMAISHLVAFDVACYSHKVADEWWTAMAPVVATGGQVVMISPAGENRGLFHRLWTQGRGFDRVTVPWLLHPDRDEEWAKPFRESLGEERFRNEFACEFREAKD